MTAVNKKLTDEPGLLNHDPFGEGWLLKARVSDLQPLANLLDGPRIREDDRTTLGGEEREKVKK